MGINFNLWETIRANIEYRGSGFCAVWFETAEAVLRGKLNDLTPYNYSSSDELHFWLQARVPKNNSVTVNGKELYDAVRQIASKYQLSVTPPPANENDLYIGYIPGKEDDIAILDGTADQYFIGNIPDEVNIGFYGPKDFAPEKLQDVYKRGGPILTNKEGEPLIT